MAWYGFGHTCLEQLEGLPWSMAAFFFYMAGQG